MRDDEAELLVKQGIMPLRPLSSALVTELDQEPQPGVSDPAQELISPQAKSPAGDPSQRVAPSRAQAAEAPEPPDSNIVYLPGAEPGEVEQADLNEIVLMGSRDYKFFCNHFFPKTFRQPFAHFHDDMWRLLNDPTKRYINIQVMRDGAKTTNLRAYTAQRIAYGLSRTILYIGASQDKARNSVQWLKRQVKFNQRFSRTFGLRASPDNWSSERIEIIHETEGHSCWVLAYGITGSVRGINLDDYRPDLIIIDDVIADDNSATPEQRDKIVNLVLGAVKESLSPATETPDAKMAILNTPQDFEDLSAKALLDTQFSSAQFGCWTKDTAELPVEFQESSWPARYPSEVLREEKRAAIARNALSIFAREKECRLITPETSSFRAEWLRYFGPPDAEPEPPLHETWVELIIDPVPPPSDIQVAKGMVGKDYEAITAVGRYKNKYYVLETVYNRGHQPNWTGATVFELANRWNPRKIIVESVAYQRTLAWLLKEAMRLSGRYWMVEEFVDKRKKIDRIVDSLAGPASNGALYVRRSQSALISQFIHYPGKNPSGTHDDVLETVAIGVASLSKGFAGDVADDHYKYREDQIEALEYQRGAP